MIQTTGSHAPFFTPRTCRIVSVMIRPGSRNLITDVAGLAVGQAEDVAARTGVSVILSDAPVNAAVDVRGGAPGTRELDVLEPSNLVGTVDAIALAGGSVFGLDACSGVVETLRRRGRGFELAKDAPRVPIVPGAILFDLANGGDKGWETPPYTALGRQAAETAGMDFALGNAGAGYGAIAGAYKGGVGSASVVTEEGFTVGALVAVNSFGSPLVTGSSVFWAWPFEIDAEFGGHRPSAACQAAGVTLPPDVKGGAAPATNTTIGIVAVDADLSRVELKRLAIMAADGFALALHPAHTPYDGDAVFAMATAKRNLAEDRNVALLSLGAAASKCMARAIARGVYAARTLGPAKSYRDHFG